MPLRVLHLTTVASPIAGAELTSVLLSRELHALGVAMEVCTLSPDGQIQQRLGALGLPASSLNARSPRSWGPGVVTLRRRLASFRPHVIHAQLFHASILGAVTATMTRLPFVITRQYILSGQAYRSRWAHLADAWCARRASHVVAISSEAKRFLEQDYGLDPTCVRVIHNAADVDRFASVARVDVASPEEELRIAYVASLLAYKGHRYLLDAMRILKHRGKHARLLLVGDGVERAALEQQVRDLDLGDRVDFLGWRQDVPQILASAHVYAHPTLEEAFGIAIAEAMAAGLPVVATRVGGIPDVVEDGRTGYLVPPNDSEALAARLAELIERPSLRTEMAAAGRARSLASFSPRQMAESYVGVFDEAARRRAP